MIRLANRSGVRALARKIPGSASGSKSNALMMFFSTKSDSFLSGSNSIYVEQMYDAWKRDPSQVHLSWQNYFGNIDNGVDPVAAFSSLPTLNGSVATSAAPSTSGSLKSDSLGLSYLISAYQVNPNHLTNEVIELYFSVCPPISLHSNLLYSTLCICLFPTY